VWRNGYFAEQAYHGWLGLDAKLAEPRLQLGDYDILDGV
jgi:hypothetical protein